LWPHTIACLQPRASFIFKFLKNLTKVPSNIQLPYARDDFEKTGTPLRAVEIPMPGNCVRKRWRRQYRYPIH
jgi:hypothetical protein